MSYQFSRTIRAASRDELLARQAAEQIDVLAEEQTVIATASELRQSSEALRDWTFSHINATTTWESFEREINSDEYRAIAERYERAKRNASILLRQREAGY